MLRDWCTAFPSLGPSAESHKDSMQVQSLCELHSTCIELRSTKQIATYYAIHMESLEESQGASPRSTL